MILVDSSVIIDYLLGHETPESVFLDMALITEIVATGDLMRTEVLQGVRTHKEWTAADRFMTGLRPIVISDWQCALTSASNYRILRSNGVTIRKTIDCLIATRCIIDDHVLLTSDRHFTPFETHLGLRCAAV